MFFGESRRPLINKVAAKIHGSGMAIAGAALEDHREKQHAEEDHAEENQHQVDIERRINLADVREGQRAEEKDGGAQHQPAAEHDFGGGRGEATRGALIGGSFGTAIKATCHCSR
jgi:hypothetical protein